MFFIGCIAMVDLIFQMAFYLNIKDFIGTDGRVFVCFFLG